MDDVGSKPVARRNNWDIFAVGMAGVIALVLFLLWIAHDAKIKNAEAEVAIKRAAAERDITGLNKLNGEELAQIKYFTDPTTGCMYIATSNSVVVGRSVYRSVTSVTPRLDRYGQVAGCEGRDPSSQEGQSK